MLTLKEIKRAQIMYDGFKFAELGELLLLGIALILSFITNNNPTNILKLFTAIFRGAWIIILFNETLFYIINIKELESYEYNYLSSDRNNSFLCTL